MLKLFKPFLLVAKELCRNCSRLCLSAAGLWPRCPFACPTGSGFYLLRPSYVSYRKQAAGSKKRLTLFFDESLYWKQAKEKHLWGLQCSSQAFGISSGLVSSDLLSSYSFQLSFPACWKSLLSFFLQDRKEILSSSKGSHLSKSLLKKGSLNSLVIASQFEFLS